MFAFTFCLDSLTVYSLLHIANKPMLHLQFTVSLHPLTICTLAQNLFKPWMLQTQLQRGLSTTCKELDGVTRNEKIFQEIAQSLATHGYHWTFQQSPFLWSGYFCLHPVYGNCRCDDALHNGLQKNRRAKFLISRNWIRKKRCATSKDFQKLMGSMPTITRSGPGSQPNTTSHAPQCVCIPG